MVFPLTTFLFVTLIFLYFYGDFIYYMHAFIYILCHCIHIIHVIYPHIHVNMYVMYSCKYVVNKLKLKKKKIGIHLNQDGSVASYHNVVKALHGLLTVTLLTLVTWKRSSSSTSANPAIALLSHSYLPAPLGRASLGFARGGGCGPVDIVAWQTETPPSSHDLINFWILNLYWPYFSLEVSFGLDLF